MRVESTISKREFYMAKVTIDSSLRAKLPDLSQPMAFQDENGKVLGFFTPVGLASPPYDKAEIPVLTKEELERLRKQPKGQPLEEILADLEKRP